MIEEIALMFLKSDWKDQIMIVYILLMLHFIIKYELYQVLFIIMGCGNHIGLFVFALKNDYRFLHQQIQYPPPYIYHNKTAHESASSFV